MAQHSPKMAQHSPKTSQLGPKMALRPPTWSQHAPKTCQLGDPLTPKNIEKQMIFIKFSMFFAMLAKLRTRSNLPSILEPRCPLNGQLGTKRATQVGGKMVLRPSKLERRWPQDLQLGANTIPRPPNLEPRWPQDLQLETKIAPSSPKTSNLKPKCPPRPPT